MVAVVVVEAPASDSLEIYNGAQPYSEGDRFYITAAWGEDDIYANQVPDEIVVGDDREFSADGLDYRNVPLRANTEYAIFTRYDIRNAVAGAQVRQ